jgi:hypothetical protein
VVVTLTEIFVTFSGASAVGGLTLNDEYQITLTIVANEYTIDAGANASSSATGGGTVTAAYQINVGTAFCHSLSRLGRILMGFWYMGRR